MKTWPPFARAVVAACMAFCWTGCAGDSTNQDSGEKDAGAETFQAEDGGPTAGKACDDCAKDSDCGPGLTCDKPAFVCKTPKQVKAGAPVCDIDCFESDFCKDEGLCTIDGLVCKATKLAHCVGSKACRENGACTPDEGKCQVTNDADCKQSTACTTDGKCTAKDGACTKTSGVKCGDGKCEGSETKQTCPKDCGPVGGDPCPCGAGVCGVKPGCPNDCGGCSGGKKCFANACSDAKCKLPAAWPKDVQRVTKLTMLNHQKGCDLDDTGKPNNMLGKLLKVYSFVNEHAFNALNSHTLNLLLKSDDYASNGKAFSIELLDANLDPAAKGSCDATFGPCKYVVKAHSYNHLAKSAECPPRTKVTGAKVTGGKLVAGGAGNALDIAVYVVGVPLVVKMQMVTMSGTVSGGSEWQTTTGGMLCGAVPATEIQKAVDSLPESALKGTGFTKKKVNELVAGLFKPDIDTDGDGKYDAMSAAWAFESGKAIAIGTD